MAIPSRCGLLEQARRIVETGALGEVFLCRVSDIRMRNAAERLVAPRRHLIIELDPSAPGAVLLGSKATLFFNGSVCRLFSATEL